jgi:hypothetical protein
MAAIRIPTASNTTDRNRQAILAATSVSECELRTAARMTATQEAAL